MASLARTRPKVGKRYMKLVARFPIRPIRNELEYDDAIKVLDELAVRDEETLSPDERDYLGALVMLVEAYDAEHYRIDTSKLTPAELLKFLVDQRGMSFIDLVEVVGSKAAASYLLSGARAPSRAQCFTLGEHFGVEPGMFLSPKSEPRHKSRPRSFVKPLTPSQQWPAHELLAQAKVLGYSRCRRGRGVRAFLHFRDGL